ncbi:hypothetical protein [Desertimonas flava]|uniref:hypothetical protein n=1 Tax=Desertimonas flava TaxID=2064846 RepID=UPI000E3500B9|nr:hypothetical protein [Desertimonas flava]
MSDEGPTAVWSIEQVVALAARSVRFAAGEAIAVPARWSNTGVGERGLWGRYDGGSAEPYDVAVDHVGVAYRCTCPSRVHPCKHVVGLLVLWVRWNVPTSPEPAGVVSWLARVNPGRAAGPGIGAEPAAPTPAGPGPGAGESEPTPPPADTSSDPADLERQRDERVARLRAGLVELDRWIGDRMRTGLADPSIARFATWDELAARLTDARAGSLANRVRRLAGKVGASPDWHADVLAELGVLHLIAVAGQRVPELPPELADAVAVACGWLIRSADVEASVPETDTWLVAGRSDNREDLIEVRRVWLYGAKSGEWALSLSFAAYRQSLDTTLLAGTSIVADLHRYPGRALRVIVGERHDGPANGVDLAETAALTVAAACDAVGRRLAREPWLERAPVIVRAAPTIGDGGWVLTDATGSLPLVVNESLPVLLAASAGAPVVAAAEWTAAGLVPLTVFADGRALDIGPRADTSFVSAA